MDRKYIAGFFDGEGSIVVQPRNLSPRIGITQCNKFVLQEIQKCLSVWGIKSYLREDLRANKNKKASYLPVHRLEIGDRTGVTAFLKLLLPYLHVKKIQAQDWLRFLQIFPALRNTRASCQSKVILD